MTTNSIREAAIDLARRGIPVFALAPRSKDPYAGSAGFYDATTDEADIASWPKDSNLGIATGDNSVIILDTDGPTGEELLRGLIKQFGPLPDTYIVKTGRVEGGRQFYFTGKGVGSKNAILGKASPGLDIKGNGGYVVAPPSVHPNGRTYTALSGDLDRIAPMPDWLSQYAKPKFGQLAEPITGPVPKGSRNDTLTSLGGSMRHRGMSYDAILAALLAENANTMQPPLPDDEVETIAKSVSGYSPSNALVASGYNMTDAGQADFIADSQGQVIRYDTLRERWAVWSDGWWLTDDEARNTVWNTAKTKARERKANSASVPDTKLAEAEFRFGLKAEDSGFIEKTMKHLSRHPLITDDGTWDTDPYVLGLPNNDVLVLQSSGATLRAARSEDRVTKRLGANPDPLMTTPVWDRFLFEIMNDDPSQVKGLYRALGYSLTGSLREPAFWLPYGLGSNGKSVLLNGVKALMGDYGYNTAFSTFERNRHGNTQTNDLAHLYGRRFVTAIETGSASALNEERLKSMSAGDNVTCRYLYNRQEFTYQSQAHIWLGVNHKPTVTDDSYGFWRRAVVIPFLRRWQKGTAYEPDENLTEKLQAEYPGILWKIAQGAAEWMRDGLQTPQSWLVATAFYRAENDELGAFITDACNAGSGHRVMASELFAAYTSWCEDQGNRRDRLTLRGFVAKLGERGYEKGHNMRGTYFDGIELKATYVPDPTRSF